LLEYLIDHLYLEPKYNNEAIEADVGLKIDPEKPVRSHHNERINWFI